MVFRTLIVLLVGLAAPLLRAADPAASPYASVDVAASRTSIYVGWVSLKMPAFIRQGTAYHSTYDAKVFPWAFANEGGVIDVTVTDDQLKQLAKGETIEITGLAVTADGAKRPVIAKATPADATHGKIKVRVTVPGSVELIFNTTYRFSSGSPGASAGKR